MVVVSRSVSKPLYSTTSTSPQQLLSTRIINVLLNSTEVVYPSIRKNYKPSEWKSFKKTTHRKLIVSPVYLHFELHTSRHV